MDDDDLERRFPAPLLIVALAVFVAGFAVTMALVVGAAVLAIGVLALAMMGRVRRVDRGKHLVAGIAVLALGGVHVARGLGAFATAPAGPEVASGPGEVRDAARAPADAAPRIDRSALLAACRADPAQCPAFRTSLQDGCTADDHAACSQLAGVLHEGLGGPVDDVAARAAAVRSCEGENTLGCANLAYLAANGIGGPDDDALALLSARFSCERDSELGCNNLAAFFADGVVSVSKAEMREHLHLTCQRNVLSGCVLLADDLVAELARTPDGDMPLLRPTLLRLCQLETAPACKVLAKLAEQGIGGAQDPALARRARDRECALGVTMVCSKGRRPIPGDPIDITGVFASNEGDHLGLIDQLQEAFGPCAAGVTEDVETRVALVLRTDGSVRLSFDADGELERCLIDHVPAVPEMTRGAEVEVAISFTLNANAPSGE